MISYTCYIYILVQFGRNQLTKPLLGAIPHWSALSCPSTENKGPFYKRAIENFCFNT